MKCRGMCQTDKLKMCRSKVCLVSGRICDQVTNSMGPELEDPSPHSREPASEALCDDSYQTGGFTVGAC